MPIYLGGGNYFPKSCSGGSGVSPGDSYQLGHWFKAKNCEFSVSWVCRAKDNLDRLGCVQRLPILHPVMIRSSSDTRN